MAVDIFNPLKDLQGNKLKTANCYRNAVSLITDKSSPAQLKKDGKLLGRPSAGRMSMFIYDPKTKAKLPYYDTFPLVLPLEPIRGGFLGLNLHYLPMVLRAKLLDGLMETTNNNKYDDSTKFTATYQQLKGAANLKPFKPCLKHYLISNVKSRLALVPSPEWEIATFLPTASFAKASAGKVHSDSRNII